MQVDPDEHVLFCGHPSWRSMVGVHVSGLFLAVLAGVVAGIASRASSGRVEAGWVAVAVVGVFALVLVWALLRRLSTTYTATDRRLVIEHGVLSRECQETRLERVQNVFTRQTLRQRLLRVGTVHFDTAASAGYDFSFHGIEEPRRLARAVASALHPARRWDPSAF